MWHFVGVRGSLLASRRLKKKLCNRRKSNTPEAIIKYNILKYQTTRSEILPITEPHEQDIAFTLSLFTKEQTPHLHGQVESELQVKD